MPLNPTTPQLPQQTMPQQSAPAQVGSIIRPPGFVPFSMVDPDNAEVYGLADRFRATIRLVRAVPYDYFRLRRQIAVRDGKSTKTITGRDGYSLAVVVYFEPDPGQGYESLDPAYYSAVSLYNFVPSLDGINVIPNATWEGFQELAEGKAHIFHGATNDQPYEHEDLLEYSGPFMAPVGGLEDDGTPKRGHRGIDLGSDWKHFLDHAASAGLKIDPAAWAAKGLAAFEGHRGRFDRIKVKNKKEGEHDVLLMTEYMGFNGVGGQVNGGQAVTGATNVQTQANQAVTPSAQAPVAAPAQTTPAAAINPAIIEFVRMALAQAGGKLATGMLISQVAASPLFTGNGVLTAEAYRTLAAPDAPARLTAAGFVVNPATAEVSLS